MRLPTLRYLIVTLLCLLSTVSQAQLLSYQLSSAQQEKLVGLWQRSTNARNSDQYLVVDRYLEALTTRLAQAHQPPIPVPSVRLIDDSQFNAFAAFGGFMGIHRGLISNLENEAQLAAIIAHELGHLYNQHSAQQIRRQAELSNQTLATTIAGILLSSLDPEVGAAVIFSGQARGLSERLAYSRAHEREADRLAETILTQAGYPKAALNQAFERMAQAQRLNGEPPTWLSTHPSATQRLSASLTGGGERPPAQGSFLLIQQLLAPQAHPDSDFAQALQAPSSEARAEALATLAVAEDPDRIHTSLRVQSACQALREECLSLASTQLQIRPADDAVRLARLQYLQQTEQWRTAFDQLPQDKHWLASLPGFWQSYTKVMEALERPDEAAYGHAQWLFWQAEEAAAVRYLNRQAERLGRPIFRQWAAQLERAHQFD